MLLPGALLLALALLCALALAGGRASAGGSGRPRSLPALPLLGSLLQLAGHPQLHLRLWRLQGRYGSLYALWMGSHYVVVVNSYRHAREVLLKKGKAFAGRPRTVSQQRVAGDPSTSWRAVGRGMFPRKVPAPGRIRVLSPSRRQQGNGGGSPSLPPSPGRILHIPASKGACSFPGLAASRGTRTWAQAPPGTLHPLNFLGTPVPHPGICPKTSPRASAKLMARALRATTNHQPPGPPLG